SATRIRCRHAKFPNERSAVCVVIAKATMTVLGGPSTLAPRLGRARRMYSLADLPCSSSVRRPGLWSEPYVTGIAFVVSILSSAEAPTPSATSDTAFDSAEGFGG